ncbi:hypothetical protein SAMN05421770_104167 [Granulicella rosea]|uniref:DUF6644 domain-containing protein n=1 Tax=Granulicella rosea TaxID=474952 RepID=A0A239JVZ7_9BACT|nr:DUF6644 family protein [Granulicella rosea]SNT10106.1 hypothetical protein SAMN05421770_104167 [Granulicella rosea]
MLLLQLSRWLGHTHLGVYIRDSSYAFPAIEIVHLLFLAIFGGAILLVDLRFLNLGFKTQSTSEVARELLPVTVVGVIGMFLSGLLMYAGGTMRYYHNPAFQAKMAFFILALLVHFTLQVGAARNIANEGGGGRLLKIGAVASLLLWVSVGFAGRVIGYV